MRDLQRRRRWRAKGEKRGLPQLNAVSYCPMVKSKWRQEQKLCELCEQIGAVDGRKSGRVRGGRKRRERVCRSQAE